MVSDTRPATLERLFIAAILMLGGWQAWVYRFKPYSNDSVSYLDLSDAALAGHLGGVVSGHWSPLYPLLIALVRAVVRPAPAWEFASLKIVNLGLLIFALFAFRWFLHEVTVWQRREGGASAPVSDGPSDTQWLAIGYILFAWAALVGISVMANTPDLGVMGFVFLTLGCVLRSWRDSAPIARAACLGAAIGLGYWCKTILLPLGIVVLPFAWIGVAPGRARLGAVVASLLALLVCAGPLVLAVSARTHTFTIGESGRLNYIWYVEPHVPDHDWAGSTADGRRSEHQPRQLSAAPHVYEFADSTVGGTYPLWTDPSYWYAGLHARLDVGKLAVRLGRNAILFWQQFGLLVIGGWLTLWLLAGVPRGLCRYVWRASVLLVPALAGLAMYAAVYDFTLKFDMRYLATSVVLLVMGLLCTVRVPRAGDRRIFAGAAFVMALVVGQTLVVHACDDLRILAGTGNDAWAVAEGLRAAGLRAGDHVAHLGDRGYYWARFLRVQIVADIPDPDEWWAASPEARQAIASRLRDLGIRAIVQRPGLPTPAAERGWQHVSGNAYVLMLR
jgi:hypothetical protein